MHLFCAAVGAGVLGLPYAVSWLGWVAGPLMLFLFFLLARWTSILLAEVYSVNGVEHAREQRGCAALPLRQFSHAGRALPCASRAALLDRRACSSMAGYHHAVRHLLGDTGARWASGFQVTNLLLLCIAFL